MKPHPKHRTAQTVLIVAEMLGYGGMSTFVAEATRLLKRHGYHVVILTVTTHPNNTVFRQRFSHAGDIRYVGINAYHGIRNKMRIVFHTIALTLRALCSYRNATVLCVGPIATTAVSPFLLLLQVPKEFVFLSPLDLELAMNYGSSATLIGRIRSRTLYLITRLGLMMFPRVLTFSNYAKRLIKEYYRIQKPIHVIPGFITIPKVISTVNIRRKLTIPQSAYVFFFPSRFEPWKRPELILQALPYIRSKKHVIVFGGYTDHEHMEKWAPWILKHGLKNRIIVVPYLNKSDLFSLYASSDCVLFPSVNLEMFGYVTLEAFTMGTPVLGTNEGAIPELLARADGRLIIPKPDAKIIAQKMNWIMHCTQREHRIIAKRCKKVAAEYNGISNTNYFLSFFRTARTDYREAKDWQPER